MMNLSFEVFIKNIYRKQVWKYLEDLVSQYEPISKLIYKLNKKANDDCST